MNKPAISIAAKHALAEKLTAAAGRVKIEFCPNCVQTDIVEGSEVERRDSRGHQWSAIFTIGTVDDSEVGLQEVSLYVDDRHGDVAELFATRLQETARQLNEWAALLLAHVKGGVQ